MLQGVSRRTLTILAIAATSFFAISVVNAGIHFNKGLVEEETNTYHKMERHFYKNLLRQKCTISGDPYQQKQQSSCIVGKGVTQAILFVSKYNSKKDDGLLHPRLSELADVQNDLGDLITHFNQVIIPYLQADAINNDAIKVQEYVKSLEDLHSQIPQISKTLGKIAMSDPEDAELQSVALTDQLSQLVHGMASMLEGFSGPQAQIPLTLHSSMQKL